MKDLSSFLERMSSTFFFLCIFLGKCAGTHKGSWNHHGLMPSGSNQWNRQNRDPDLSDQISHIRKCHFPPCTVYQINPRQRVCALVRIHHKIETHPYHCTYVLTGYGPTLVHPSSNPLLYHTTQLFHFTQTQNTHTYKRN